MFSNDASRPLRREKRGAPPRPALEGRRQESSRPFPGVSTEHCWESSSIGSPMDFGIWSSGRESLRKGVQRKRGSPWKDRSGRSSRSRSPPLSHLPILRKDAQAPGGLGHILPQNASDAPALSPPQSGKSGKNAGWVRVHSTIWIRKIGSVIRA